MPVGKIKFFTSGTLFTAQEKQNIFFYIFGIMLYKFGVEAFNGAIITLATNRYDQDAHATHTETRTFEKVGLLIGLNQASQCIGSVLIGPLIKRWRTQMVLSITIFVFAVSTSVFMIVDVTTGGYMRPNDFRPAHKNDFHYYGKYRTDILLPIYGVAGLTFGMVESIRRVIPANIAGENVIKLRKMDALVHVFYEIAGVSGALMVALVLMPRLGDNYAFIITPILFTAAGLVWLLISSVSNETNESETDLVPNLKSPKVNCCKAIGKTLFSFIQSICTGAKIVFTNRKFLWLFFVYPLALYSHRYIENSIGPQVARRYLNRSDWSQILIGGSNFGELLGALFTFYFSHRMNGPILWVRLNALMFFILWYIPFYYPPTDQIKYAWLIAATLIPLGFSSAISDISLDSFIQSSLTRMESKHKNVSPLGAVMAFLYSTYIIIYLAANPVLGRHIDHVYNSKGTVQTALIYTVGAQLTVIFLVMTLATFIPRGARSLNPVLNEEDETSDTNAAFDSPPDQNINLPKTDNGDI